MSHFYRSTASNAFLFTYTTVCLFTNCIQTVVDLKRYYLFYDFTESQNTNCRIVHRLDSPADDILVIDPSFVLETY